MRSRHPLCTSVAALTLVAGLWLAPPAYAGGSAEPVVAYREAVARGSKLFDARDWAAARASFEAAYAIHGEPVLLFNIASCYRREGELERAIEKYRAFLAAAADDDPRRALAARTIGDLEETIEMRTSPPPEPAAPPEPPAPAPPTALEPVAPPALEPHRGGGGGVLRWSGVACGVAGLVTAGLALSSSADAADAELRLESLERGAPWNLDQQDLYDEGKAAQRSAIIYSIASAALVTTGVVLYVTGERRRHRATTMSIAPTGDGGMMSLSRPF